MLSAMSRIAIIGGGNLGEALLSGLLRAGRRAEDVVVVERMAPRATYLSETYAVAVAPGAEVAEAVAGASFIIVAVKPADVAEFLDQISGVRWEQTPVIVSVAAGVTVGFYESRLGAGTPVIRAMPNAAALVGAGVTALARGRWVDDDQYGAVAGMLEAVGAVLTVAESQMDAVTAVSGSGPAYFLLMVEALVDAGVAAGLTRAVASELAAHTLAGSGAMLLDRMGGGRPGGSGPGLDTSPAQLRAMVTSPGGTTAAGLRELERGGLRAAVDAAIQAAQRRSQQLSITVE